MNHRIMRSHLTRKHKPAHSAESCSVEPKRSAGEYDRCAKGGMPTCRLCGANFTRVESLKKHVNRGCTKKPEQDEVWVSQAPAPPTGSPAGSEEQPLFQDAAFRRVLQQGWKSVVQNPDLCASLRTYCVFCHQWISLIGPGCKKHHRLMRRLSDMP